MTAGFAAECGQMQGRRVRDIPGGRRKTSARSPLARRHFEAPCGTGPRTSRFSLSWRGSFSHHGDNKGRARETALAGRAIPELCRVATLPPFGELCCAQKPRYTCSTTNSAPFTYADLDTSDGTDWPKLSTLRFVFWFKISWTYFSNFGRESQPSLLDKNAWPFPLLGREDSPHLSPTDDELCCLRPPFHAPATLICLP